MPLTCVAMCIWEVSIWSVSSTIRLAAVLLQYCECIAILPEAIIVLWCTTICIASHNILHEADQAVHPLLPERTCVYILTLLAGTGFGSGDQRSP